MSAAPLEAQSTVVDPNAPATAIVVTASRTDAVTPGVTTLTTSDIERLQPVSLLDALNDVAGVRAFSTGGVGGNSFVSIRGGEPNFTLVLLDGIKLNNPTNSRGGAFDFVQIDPLLVDSVTVVRGAVSAVHGSDALSGAIAIRLRDPARGTNKVALTVQGGTRQNLGANASVQRGWGSGSLLASVGLYESGDLDRASNLNRRQALVRVGQDLAGFDAVLLGLHAASDRTTFPESSGGPLLAVNRARETTKSKFWTAGLTIRRKPHAALRPNLSLSFSKADDAIDTPAIAPGVFDGVPAIAANTRFTRFEAIADLGFKIGPIVATVGGSVLLENGRSDGSIDFGFRQPVAFALTRTTRAAFAETTLRPTRSLTVNLAGRIDAPEGAANRFTGRGSISFHPRVALPEFYAHIGQGYKLPSFYALGHPLVGNRNLRPERSINAEIGFVWMRGSGTRVRVAAFQNRFRDLIDFDPALFTTVNRDHVRARGIEGEVRWQAAPTIAFAGAVTWLDLDSATPLRNRPRWNGNVRGVWQPVRDLEFDAAFRANGDFYDSAIPTGLFIAQGHVEFDVGVRYRLSKALGAAIAVRNIGDNRFEDTAGFPAPGRTVRLTLSAAVS